MRSHTASTRRRCAYVWLLATAVGMLLLGSAAHAQEPLTAKIFFKNLPPGPVPTYDLAGTSKITIVIQVNNPGSSPVLATTGTFGADFWRRLFVTDPLGGLGTFTGPLVHPDTQLYFCHSRQGVLQRPTAIPVAPLEVIPAGATVEWEVTDLRKFYAVPQIGRYVVQLRSPVITVLPSGPAAVVSDCDQGPDQTFIDLSVDTSPSRYHFTLESNQLEFFVGSAYTFAGFLSPIINDSACPNPTVSPCVTAQKNSTVVLKFQLFNGSTPITNAVATVSATQISGTTPLQPPDNLGRGPRADNQYKYDAGANQYVFTLNTAVLSVGVWRVDTTISDGSVHSVHIGVR